MEPPYDDYERLVSEAFRSWLLGQGSVSEFVPLKSLFSLAFVGAVPFSSTDYPPFQVTAQTAHAPAQLHGPQPALGTSLVRLLDGCLASAASLPTRQQRRHAAANVISAFCTAALREAYLRVHGPTRPRNPGHQPPPATLDSAFLDAAFSLLTALAARYSQLSSEVQLMEMAWGGAEAVPPSSPPQSSLPSPVQHDVAADGRLGITQYGAAVSNTEHLADFFLDPDFQCKMAAGQMLYGGSYDNSGCGGSNVVGVPYSGWCGGGWGAAGDGGGSRHHAVANAGEAQAGLRLGVTTSRGGDEQLHVTALTEVPVLAELCAAAAAAGWWRELVGRVAEGGPTALVRWLGPTSLGAWDGASEDGRVPPSRGLRRLGTSPAQVDRMAGEGGTTAAALAPAGLPGAVARCCGYLVAAMAQRPGAMLAAVPAPLLTLLSLQVAEVRQGLLTALASILIRVQEDNGVESPNAVLQGGSPSVGSRPTGLRATATSTATAEQPMYVGAADTHLKLTLGSYTALPRVLCGDGVIGGHLGRHLEEPELGAYLPSLQACFGVLGWDLGQMLQLHLGKEAGIGGWSCLGR